MQNSSTTNVSTMEALTPNEVISVKSGGTFFQMSAILALIGITVQIQIVSGIDKETIKVKVHKGQTVVLKCSNSEEEAAWLGPDVNNAEKIMVVYFSNNKMNPKLNQTKYSLQENEGGYDLIIVNFLEENAGFYICRFQTDGTFHQTKYNVALVYMLSSTTLTYDEEGNTVPDNATGYATNTTILLEDDVGYVPIIITSIFFFIMFSPNDICYRRYTLLEEYDLYLSVSFDIRTLIWMLSVFFIFIMTAVCTVVLSSRVRRYSHVVHIVGPNVHIPSIPIYYSAPESENNRHIYDQFIPQYLEVIESEEQDDLSDSSEDESTDEIVIAVLDQTSHDYEEIQ